MSSRGRPVLGFVSGFLLGVFVAIDLLVLGVVGIGSTALTILPVVGAALGLGLALWAPIPGRTPPPPPPPPLPTEDVEPGGPLA